jgi:hypothetical protein
MYVLHCENLMTLLADLGYEETENAFKYVFHRLKTKERETARL